MKDVIIVGAGPVGLSCAIEAQINNLDYTVLEKGCITNSIYNFPTNMVFFSTPKLLEIGNIPFITPKFRPNRVDVLNYYRSVVDIANLHVRCFEKVVEIKNNEDGFSVITELFNGSSASYKTKNIIIATGFYDNPNPLNIKGEELSKVLHYFREGHQYHGMHVAVVGGNNSAVETAIDLLRNGVKVTLIHRGDNLGKKAKYWIVPELKKSIDDGTVSSLFNTDLKEIKKDTIIISNKDNDSLEIKNDFVFAMIGYRPDTDMLKRFGINFNGYSLVPDYSDETFETNRKGIFVAGSIMGGIQNNKIFIETGRFHGKKLIDYVLRVRPAK